MTKIFNSETRIPYLILLIVFTVSIYPFFYMISTSLMTAVTVSDFYLPFISNGDGGSGTKTGTSEVNFGNPPFAISSGNSDANGYGNFEYAVPSGYYALCTQNLAQYG